jgi:hypothetical protein
MLIVCSDEQIYKDMKRTYHAHLENAKWKYLNEKITEVENDNKKLFHTLFTMIGRVKSNPLPTYATDDVIAEDFVEFFMNKIIKIREDLKEEAVYQPPTRRNCDVASELREFRQMSETEVRKIVSESKPTTCWTDPCPSTLIKKHLDTLLPVITKLVNISLTIGDFAHNWKTSIIIPLLKKANLSLEMKNFRPVNNLPFVSKIVEKGMLAQLNCHMKEHNLLPDYLSAYRSHYSTETILTKLMNDLLMAMDKQKITVLTAVDLSAAFDTVDHDILLKTLEESYGVKDNALRWFNQYLRPRTVKVQVNNQISKDRKLPFSVPQGSCAGPVLYNIYTSSLPRVIEDFMVNLLGYADDQLLYDAFNASSREEENDAIKKLEACLDVVNTWMKQNRLKMNPEKTEFIMIGNKVQLDKCVCDKIEVDGKAVEKADEIKFLGVWIDNTVSMKKQIKEVCKRTSKLLHVIWNIRRYLNEKTCQRLVAALITSKMDYANGLYANLPATTMRPLQLCQNYAARVIKKARKRDHVTPLLYNLHWLPYPYRVNYKVLITVFKCIQSEAPDYLCQLINKKTVRRNTRSSRNHLLLDIPTTKCKTFGDKSFGCVGPRLWNSLPHELQKCEKLEVFKTKLKTHLFKEAYANLT